MPSPERVCARCGKKLDPYQWGEINGVRYCHTDEEDPSCYVQESWKGLRTRSGLPLTDALIERVAAEMEAGYDPARLRPRLPRHAWVPGQGGICTRCSLAGRVRWDDLGSPASLGFLDDPIHQVDLT